MDTVTSKDGTAIAFDRYGTGTPVILVGGAFQYRAFDHRTAKLARLISADHTVLHYDRRGRGDSGNTMPYTVEREIDDIQALIEAVGGSAGVFGMSSGGALALEAAKSSPAITKLLRWVGTPAPIMTLMRCTPMWPKFKAVAPTLPYDVKIIAAHHRGQPLNRMEWAAVRMPALVAFGGKSPDWISNGMRALAGALPDGRSAALPGQNHMIKPEVLAPTLIEFFAD